MCQCKQAKTRLDKEVKFEINVKQCDTCDINYPTIHKKRFSDGFAAELFTNIVAANDAIRCEMAAAGNFL